MQTIDCKEIEQVSGGNIGGLVGGWFFGEAVNRYFGEETDALFDGLEAMFSETDNFDGMRTAA